MREYWERSQLHGRTARVRHSPKTGSRHRFRAGRDRRPGARRPGGRAGTDPQRHLRLRRDRALVGHRQHHARRQRGPALRRRAGRHHEPVGRHHRPGQHPAGRRRDVRLPLLRPGHPGQGRQGARPAARRPVHPVSGRQPGAVRLRQRLRVHLHLAGRPAQRAGRVPDRRQRRPVADLPRQHLADRRRRSRRVRAGHRPAGPGQPGRLPAQGSEERHRRHRGDRPVAVAAEERRRHRRQERHDHAARRGRQLRPERAHHRLRTVREGGHRLHAGGRRRDQPPVRHRLGLLRAAAARRAEVLLHPAQRPRDPRRPAPGVRAAGRPRGRRAEPRRHVRAVPARRLRLHIGRSRRLVRRRRPRQVRRQRRHLRPPADERVRAFGPRAYRRVLDPARRDARRSGERQPRAGRPRRGAVGAGVPAADAGPGRPAVRRHGPPQGPRLGLDRPAAPPAPRPAGARAAPGLDRRHAQPRRDRGPGGARVPARTTRASPRRTWRRRRRRGRRPRPTRRSTPTRPTVSAAAPTTTPTSATSSTGPRPSCTSRPAAGSTGTSCSPRRTTPATSGGTAGSTGATPPSSAGSSSPPCPTCCRTAPGCGSPSSPAPTRTSPR